MRTFFFGVGYCAEALIGCAPEIEPAGTARSADKVVALRAAGVDAYAFDGMRGDSGVEAALARAEAIVVSIPPREAGQGPLDHFAGAIAAAPNLERIVTYSTVGVYGEHGLAFIDETAATLTREPRSLARLKDEARWREAGRAAGAEVDILRLPGIYGPGRNALERLAAGEARRVVKPGHVVNRAHVADIAEMTRLVLTKGLEGGIWNVADDEAAPPQDVIAYAASLMGVPPPPEEPFETAGLTPMAASFYAETKRISNARAKARLGFSPLYPTYREGLRALFEAGEGRRV